MRHNGWRKPRSTESGSIDPQKGKEGGPKVHSQHMNAWEMNTKTVERSAYTPLSGMWEKEREYQCSQTLGTAGNGKKTRPQTMAVCLWGVKSVSLSRLLILAGPVVCVRENPRRIGETSEKNRTTHEKGGSKMSCYRQKNKVEGRYPSKKLFDGWRGGQATEKKEEGRGKARSLHEDSKGQRKGKLSEWRGGRGEREEFE